jgi:predicted transcriptional regulator
VLADQHFNPVNPEAHYRTTGPEIWEQTEGRITHFVCSPGTGGTVSGAGRYLKEKNPKVRVVAGDPAGSIYSEYAQTHVKGPGSPYKVEGIGGDKIPTSLHFDVIDEWITVTDADAFRTARRMTREEGIFLGGSGGLNVFTALEVARRVDDPDAMIVTILCDTGERYLSKLYDDAWMRENQMLEAERVTAGLLLERYPREMPAIVSVTPTGNVRQALNLMSTWGVSQIPVIDGKDCVGSLSEGPLMARALEDGKVLDRPVSEVIGAPFPVVDADVPLDRLVSLLSKVTPAARLLPDHEEAFAVVERDARERVERHETVALDRARALKREDDGGLVSQGDRADLQLAQHPAASGLPHGECGYRGGLALVVHGDRRPAVAFEDDESAGAGIGHHQDRRERSPAGNLHEGTVAGANQGQARALLSTLRPPEEQLSAIIDREVEPFQEILSYYSVDAALELPELGEGDDRWQQAFDAGVPDRHALHSDDELRPGSGGRRDARSGDDRERQTIAEVAAEGAVARSRVEQEAERPPSVDADRHEDDAGRSHRQGDLLGRGGGRCRRQRG